MNTPIRLALVITELDVGGAEQCLVELATRLDRERFAPVAYSLARRPPERDRLVRQLTDAGIETVFLNLRPRAGDFFAGVRRLAALLRKQQAEVVQTFLFHANAVGATAARSAGVQQVVCGLRVAEPKRWRLWTERCLARSARRFVCVSEGVARFYREHGFAAERLTVIPNGIDVDRFATAGRGNLEQFGVSPSRRILLYIGRLHPQKGLTDLLQAMPEVLRELPNHDLLLVGDGSEREALQSLARRLGIEHRVHFAGWRPDVPAILAGAEMVLLPSRWEGMPNVLLEAMASGKPVVATRAEGVDELLGDTSLEQTVPLGDMREFTERIAAIASNPNLASDLARRNQLRARQFSWERMVAQYEHLYFSLAGR
jgi:glycosyltransferase involved in cell wall biosynthesis